MRGSSGAEPARVLVVDDNEQNRRLVEAILRGAGYSTTLAQGGPEALREFEAARFDLVVLDIMMPVINGFEVCRRLRATDAGKDVVIIFLTAAEGLPMHELAVDSRADDFLTKPISRTELLVRVRSLLRLRRLTRELQDQYELARVQRDALARVQKQKEDLTALVVHDLKSPLSSVLANVQFIAEDPGLSNDARDSARDIQIAANAMHRMVMNLLDISRSEDGALVPNRSTVAVGEVVAELFEVLKARTDAARVHLAWEERGTLGAISVDRDMLMRVLENLVDNCIKFSPPDGRIVVEAETRKDGQTKTGRGEVHICVRDEGTGIPKEQRDRIFEKYVQLDGGGPTQRARSSRGLGLVFCRLAVEAHGGRISVEDNVPQGACFRIVLPASA